MEEIVKFPTLFLMAIVTFFTACVGEETSDPKVIPIKTLQPLDEKIYPIAVIGAGAAGTMAAQRAVLNNDEVLVFAGAKQERRRSRGNWVRTVDNIPGLGKYKRTILELRNEVLKDLHQSPLSHHLFLIEESVMTITKEADKFVLVDGTGRIYYAKYVVLATGIMDEQPHIQGSIRPILDFANGQTAAYCLVCDGHRAYGKDGVVIGYSSSAAKVAMILAEKYQLPKLSILTNGHPPEFTTEQAQQLKEKQITVIEEPILEILGDREQKLLSGFKMENGQEINANIAFVALGIRPNNDLAIQLGAELDASKLVITDANGETSVPNLFVVGDLRANSMKQIYTAWQHAVESVQLINKRLREESPTPRSCIDIR
jgi:thioredoxin reductase (NADPH)